MEEVIIECPKCQWRPDGGPYWQCTCGTTWNTFATQGICPGCGKRWKDTQCIQWNCQAWSPHVDWYVIPLNLGELLEAEEPQT
jgi:hypothetical protein